MGSKFGTRAIVATGLGAALFTLLFMFVKIPTFVPETQLQSAYGVGAFFAVLFGPLAGVFIQFVGHALSDAFQYGSPWWSWVISSGVAGAIYGLARKRVNIADGRLTIGAIVWFNVYQVVGNAIAWAALAPILDIVIYAEPANKVFAQGAVAFVGNSISVGIIGTLLLITYAKTRPRRASLA